jgi:hypothetical protein
MMTIMTVVPINKSRISCDIADEKAAVTVAS